MYRIILNPFAGKGKAFKSVSEVEELFDKFGLDYEVILTDSPKQAIEFAQQAIQNGLKKIIAAGGDGTINEVVNGIIRSGKQNKIIFGIIALGGGNDFVKNFHYPKLLQDQIKKFIKPKIKKIDVGKIEEFYFINTFGVGFDAQVARSYANNLILNGSAGYYKAVMKELLRLKPYQIRIKLDGEVFTGKKLLISVANGRWCGGKFQLTPKAEIDDGLFDVCIIDYLNRFRIMQLLPKAQDGGHVGHPKVHICRTKSIFISSEIALPVYFDGELPILKNSKQLRIDLLPAQINLII